MPRRYWEVKVGLQFVADSPEEVLNRLSHLENGPFVLCTSDGPGVAIDFLAIEGLCEDDVRWAYDLPTASELEHHAIVTGLEAIRDDLA